MESMSSASRLPEPSIEEVVNGIKIEILPNDSEESTPFRDAAISAAAWGAFGALCGGAWGLAFGLLAGAPILLSIGLFAADTAVTRATNSVVGSLGKQYNLKDSTVSLIKAAVVGVVSTAFIVTAVSLGVFGALGQIGFFVLIAGVGVLWHLLWSNADDEVKASVDEGWKKIKATMNDASAEIQKNPEELQVEDVTDLDPTVEGSRQ